MSGSLPCFSHISASRDVGQLRTTLSAFLHRSINTLMSSNLMTLTHQRAPAGRDRPGQTAGRVQGTEEVVISGGGCAAAPTAHDRYQQGAGSPRVWDQSADTLPVLTTGGGYLVRMESASPNHGELSASTATQRAQALERFRLIRLFLEDGVPLTHIAAQRQLSVRTLRRWVRQYRAHGLAGLMRAARKDQGQRRSVTAQLQQIIEGLALQKPRRTLANIHRETARLCRERGWPQSNRAEIAEKLRAADVQQSRRDIPSPVEGT